MAAPATTRIFVTDVESTQGLAVATALMRGGYIVHGVVSNDNGPVARWLRQPEQAWPQGLGSFSLAAGRDDDVPAMLRQMRNCSVLFLSDVVRAATKLVDHQRRHNLLRIARTHNIDRILYSAAFSIDPTPMDPTMVNPLVANPPSPMVGNLCRFSVSEQLGTDIANGYPLAAWGRTHIYHDVEAASDYYARAGHPAWTPGVAVILPGLLYDYLAKGLCKAIFSRLPDVVPGGQHHPPTWVLRCSPERDIFLIDSATIGRAVAEDVLPNFAFFAQNRIILPIANQVIRADQLVRAVAASVEVQGAAAVQIDFRGGGGDDLTSAHVADRVIDAFSVLEPHQSPVVPFVRACRFYSSPVVYPNNQGQQAAMLLPGEDLLARILPLVRLFLRGNFIISTPANRILPWL